MTFEEIKKKMGERGYSLHSFGASRIDANRLSANFTKVIVDGVFIHATVTNINSSMEEIELVHVWGLVIVSSQKFAFENKSFELFESKIEKAALMLNERSAEEWSYYGNVERKRS